MRGLRRSTIPGPGRGGKPRVLVISASMGAGHDGAARELAARLRADGHDAEVRDFLEAAPLRIGALVRRGYEFELRHAPGAYDATYRLWYRVPWLCPLVAWLVTALTRRRVLRWVRRDGIGIVVSTYPLATLCLGRLRSLGALRIPAVNFITDFGVHPLWVHRGMDLNLAVHAAPADVARARTGRPSIACGPLVSEAYDPDRAATAAVRAEGRAALGLGPGDRAVLIVAGSWGVGSVEQTFRVVAASGRFVPVVVCGRDETLRARVARLASSEAGRAVVLGWTDRMPLLMAACDALLENAGGLTSLEAMRIGLPVVSYDPIAGHGRENTSAMAAAGVSRLAADPAELLDALALATGAGPARDGQIAAGRAMFAADGARLVAGTGHPDAVAALAEPRRARVVAGTAKRTAVGLFALAAIGWGGITSGVSAAASAGAGVAHAPAGVNATAFVGVRVDAAELADPAVTAEVRALGASIVVDEVTAASGAATLRRLAAAGTDIENGGRGFRPDLDGDARQGPEAPWTRAADDAAAGVALSDELGHHVRLLVPGRRINAFDLIESGRAHETLVIAGHEIVASAPDETVIPVPAAHQILLVNGLQATPLQLLGTLHRLAGVLATADLHVAALSTLR